MGEHLSKLNFLKTYDFHNFKIDACCEGVALQAVALKGAWVEAKESNLDLHASWDLRVYGPLTDLMGPPFEDQTTDLHFLLKVVRVDKDMRCMTIGCMYMSSMRKAPRSTLKCIKPMKKLYKMITSAWSIALGR